MEKLKPTLKPPLNYPKPYAFHKISCCSQESKPHEPNKLSSLIWSIPDWADAVKERGMRKNRSLYTPDDWRVHRSSRRHLRHLLSSLSSRVILSLVPPVISFTSFAALLALYNSAVSMHWLPEFLPVLRASPLPYQLTAPALALLLVFRTEASYSRFDEGKKCWMRVVAGAGELAGLVMGIEGKSDDDGGDRKIKGSVLGYIMAFPVALKCHVISGSDIRADLQNLLEEDDIAVVLSSKHRPRCLIEFISQSLQILHLEEPKRNMLVGVLIEDPFPMLALDELCRQLHDSIRETMAMERSVQMRLAAKMKIHHDGHPINGWPNS